MTKMLKTATLALAAAASLAGTLPAAAAPQFAAAQSAGIHNGSDAPWQNHRDRRSSWNDRGYDNGGRYDEPVYANTRTWRGDDGRTYCRRANGTTGLLIGGAVGGLIGNEIAGRRGDRTLGVILGVAGGALLGREIDRSGSRCR